MDSSIIEMMVNSFTDADELMNFAATWGIQDSREVRFRLFQIRNSQYGDEFVNEQIEGILQSLGGPIPDNSDSREDDLELALEYVRERQEMEESIKALLFDDEMEETTRICIEDGEWEPQSIQTGGGEEPRAGPFHEPEPSQSLQYTIRKKSERAYAQKCGRGPVPTR